MKPVHLDHNATTPMRPEVRERLLEVLDSGASNPSSLHGSGRRARQIIDEARERTAAALGVDEDEVLFTPGGTEANNLALFGSLPPGSPLVTSAVEHSSVLEPARRLAEGGHAWRCADVDTAGLINPERVAALALADPEARAGLVSVMAANNEVGMVQPLQELGLRLRQGPGSPPLFHTDAVQALGRVDLRLHAWGVDLASFSAHKLGGPLGVGVLFRRAGVSLRPLLFGGGQEQGLRPGTENVPAIAAASLAFELAVQEREAFAERASRLARGLWRDLSEVLPGARLVGPPIDSAGERLPGTLNIVLPELDGKVLVTRLDLAGLEASAGSACASGSLEPSHVLRAMGFTEEHARAGLRLSVGRDTTLEDTQQAVDILRKTCG